MRLEKAELAIVGATYLGLAVPLFDGLVGRVVPGLGRGGAQPLDAHGARLESALLPGDDWRRRHDVLLRMIILDARRAGLRVREEKELRRAFAHVLPPEVLGEDGGPHPRGQRGFLLDRGQDD